MTDDTNTRSLPTVQRLLDRLADASIYTAAAALLALRLLRGQRGLLLCVLDEVGQMDGDGQIIDRQRDGSGHLLLALCALGATAAEPPKKQIVLKGARLFDGRSDRVISPATVVVSDGRIQSINGSAPAGAEVIDLGDVTLLPGFMDAHTHISMDYSNDFNASTIDGLRKPVSEQALDTVPIAQKTLMAGFTTVFFLYLIRDEVRIRLR